MILPYVIFHIVTKKWRVDDLVIFWLSGKIVGFIHHNLGKNTNP